MSDKHPNPHQQQAPVHDSEEAQPRSRFAGAGRSGVAYAGYPRASNPPPQAAESADTHNSQTGFPGGATRGEDFPLTTAGRAY